MLSTTRFVGSAELERATGWVISFGLPGDDEVSRMGAGNE